MFLNLKNQDIPGNDFILNRKHEMFLNRKMMRIIIQVLILNRKHEMFLNMKSISASFVASNLTVNMKCF